MTPFKNPTILKILDYYKNLWALSYVSGIAHWDLETYMPVKAIGSRSMALGRIATIKQKMFLDKSFTSLLSTANSLQNLTDREKAVVRVLNRELKFYSKIPKSFLEEFEKLTNKATVVWREAKSKDNFKLFEKDLTRIFDMNRQMAEYLGYQDSPYDALLDLFEEGLTSNSVNQLFTDTKEALQKLLKQIINSKKYQKTHWLENASYNKEEMIKLNNKILNFLWQDMDRFRLDVSSHPFTTSFGINDTRITTWYHDSNFARSLLAVIHEFGHALYDLQSDPVLEMTPIAGGSSLVIHESQSRFWENHIGRSRQFIKKFKTGFEQVVGRGLETEDVYAYFNKVKPSLLRVEADEITYHFHIMLRFEIEKGIIEEKLKVKDLPEIWNEKMKSYLAITPKKDSDGVLQDIHWSGGSVGYFPTYSLGTFLAAQWAESMKIRHMRVGPSQTRLYKRSTFTEIKDWLKDHIHQFGSTYTLEEALKKNKLNFDPMINIVYLQEKYKKIYNFK